MSFHEKSVLGRILCLHVPESVVFVDDLEGSSGNYFSGKSAET